MTLIKTLIKKMFRWQAELVLKKYKPKVIAITGSVGKTTTREALYLILSKKFFVRRSQKSFTADLGIPLTILGSSQGSGSVLDWLQNIFAGLLIIIRRVHYPEVLILEIDADKPGDLSGLSQWLHPDVLVLTGIGEVPAHIETFPDVEGKIKEKKNFAETVNREGFVVFNADEERSSQVVENISVKKISCGMYSDSSVRGTVPTILYGNSSVGKVPTGIQFDIAIGDEKNGLTIFDSIGTHLEYACMLSLAVGKEFGMSLPEMISALKNLKSLPGRMSLVSGLKDTLLIDDSYNASPLAMRDSIRDFLAVETTGRKIAVVGDMLELGKYSIGEHRKVAEYLASKGPDALAYVLSVGIRSRSVCEELLDRSFEDSKILSFDTSREAGLKLQEILQPGDLVLIKGSQGMRMERIVEEVMRHPEDAEKLLVRQEKEWKGRE